MQLCQSFPQRADTQSALYKGTSNFRKQTLRDHHQSKKHKLCVEASKEKERRSSLQQQPDHLTMNWSGVQRGRRRWPLTVASGFDPQVLQVKLSLVLVVLVCNCECEALKWTCRANNQELAGIICRLANLGNPAPGHRLKFFQQNQTVDLF